MVDIGRGEGAIPLHDAVFIPNNKRGVSCLLDIVLDVTSTKFYLSTTKSRKTWFLPDIILTSENRTAHDPRLSYDTRMSVMHKGG